MNATKRFLVGIGFFALGLVLFSCGNKSSTTHSTSQLLPALLRVADVSFIPAEWEENMRTEVLSPSAPWENTLDPYLCPEAGTPTALTRPQVQLELTGGSVMETLLSTNRAHDVFQELDEAYRKCGTGTSTQYSALADAPDVGDESASYKTKQGIVTIARFNNDIMILKWWVGDYYKQLQTYYPDLVTAAGERVAALSD